MDKELEDLIYSPNTTGKDINEYFYRIDKEELFLSIIKDYSIKEDKKKYPDSIFYFNPDGEILFELNKKTKLLWCNWDLVWNVFYDTYGMKSSEIESFIRDQVEKHFKLKDVTPDRMLFAAAWRVEKHFKLKDVTPHRSEGLSPWGGKTFQIEGCYTTIFNNTKIKIGGKTFQIEGCYTKAAYNRAYNRGGKTFQIEGCYTFSSSAFNAFLGEKTFQNEGCYTYGHFFCNSGVGGETFKIKNSFVFLIFLFIFVEKILIMSQDQIYNFRDWCFNRHDVYCNQRYGKNDSLPYSYHLDMVLQLCLRYNHLLSESDRDIALMVAVGHDLIEDARVSYNDIKDRVGIDVADAIYLLTEYKGKNRNERHSREYYEEIAKNDVALFVKLCDIMANILYSFQTNSSMFLKYRKEFEKVQELTFNEKFIVLYHNIKLILFSL